MIEHDSEPRLVSREPWWAEPPKPGESDADLQWGYLEIYEDGSTNFDPTRPSEEEIKNRRSCRLT